VDGTYMIRQRRYKWYQAGKKMPQLYPKRRILRFQEAWLHDVDFEAMQMLS
jgi:hypothetical protein